MEYLYVLTLIILGIGFVLFKKSNEKLSFIKWICIFICGIFAYNITICMILGILHITQDIWLLSIINTIVGILLLYKPIRYHEIQKYKCSKFDIISIIVICILFCVMYVKDLYIFKGDVTHFAIDSAIHYRAAKHYSENLQLFVFIEDKTFFDFNIMQTGAYINDGIFMNIINNLTRIDHIYIYQLFETVTLFLSGLAFYVTFIDKIKTKRGLIGSLLLFALYIYGYPYNSWTYGFSYLSVGILMSTLLLAIVEMVYSSENIKKSVVITMLCLASMGLIFSYCLFVPAVFSSICIYSFVVELKDKENKKHMKIFGKNTLIITGLLLLITLFGIGYLFIPSFIIDGQKDLVSALKEDGGIYPEKYKNFIAYIPFAIIYLVELVKRIKERNYRFLDSFSVCVVGYLGLFYIGMLFGKISPYYMLKIYFIIWIVIFSIAIDILNNDINKKLFRLDAIILVYLFAFLAIKKVSSEVIFRTYLILLLVLFTTLPETIKTINLSKVRFLPKKLKKTVELSKIRVSPFVYVLALSYFITGWVWIKSGTILGEEEKHSLMNLVGMYYTENCEYRKAIDVIQNFSSNNIEVTKFARENLKDMTADNTILMTESFYRTTWGIATLEYTGKKLTFRDIINTTNQHNIEDTLENQEIKYIVRLDSNEESKKEECKQWLEQLENEENVDIIYSNQNGFIAKINR